MHTYVRQDYRKRKNRFCRRKKLGRQTTHPNPKRDKLVSQLTSVVFTPLSAASNTSGPTTRHRYQRLSREDWAQQTRPGRTAEAGSGSDADSWRVWLRESINQLREDRLEVSWTCNRSIAKGKMNFLNLKYLTVSLLHIHKQ